MPDVEARPRARPRELSVGSTGEGEGSRRYRLVAPIARGGMGELFLAEVADGSGVVRRVVIKRLLEEYQTDDEYREMFRFEADVMRHLDHPNVVKILDAPLIDGVPCLSMEYVRGRSAGQLIDRQNDLAATLPVGAVLRILIGVLDGLDHVHNARLPDGTPLGLVHRDVTPGNLLLGFDGAVKLTDFGIAKGQASGLSTTVGIVKGKARYLAPEQILGERASPRSDIFSVACVAYEMLTGLPLFDQPSVPKTLHAIVNGLHEPLAAALPAEAQPLVPVLTRALSTRPDRRQASARELGDDLVDLTPALGGAMRADTLGAFVLARFEAKLEPWERDLHAPLPSEPPAEPTGPGDGHTTDEQLGALVPEEVTQSERARPPIAEPTLRLDERTRREPPLETQIIEHDDDDSTLAVSGEGPADQRSGFRGGEIIVRPVPVPAPPARPPEPSPRPPPARPAFDRPSDSLRRRPLIQVVVSSLPAWKSRLPRETLLTFAAGLLTGVLLTLLAVLALSGDEPVAPIPPIPAEVARPAGEAEPRVERPGDLAPSASEDPTTAVLEVRFPRGAKVSVDGKRVGGEVPLAVRIQPGIHQIRVEDRAAGFVRVLNVEAQTGRTLLLDRLALEAP